MHALFNLFRNVMNYSNLWKIDWKGKITLKIVQARGTHTPTQMCAQPYHARSSSHGQLFGIYWVHQHERGNPCLKDSLLPSRRVQSKECKVPAPRNTCGKADHGLVYVQSASSTQHMWEGGSWVGVCAPLALSLSFENSELNCCTA